MKAGTRVHAVVHKHRRAVDAGTAVVVLAVVLAAIATKHSGADPSLTWPVAALEILVILTLALRNTWPVPVLGLTVAGSAVVMLLLGRWSPVAAAAVIAVYTVAVHKDRWITLKAALAAGAGLVLGGAWRTGDWFSGPVIALLAWTGFAAALGNAVRTSRAYVAAVEERAVRAERTREEEAARRVVEERMRIARELHDVVAHHIAVIQVQAGVVDHLMVAQPETAREALGHVRRSSRMVLEELSGMLDILRQPGDPVTPTDPAPGLDRLVDLIDSFAASGLRVERQITGEPVPLPAAVDLVAYRLVQEGLTNAHKHGTGSARLRLDFEPDGLLIDIRNEVRAEGEDPAGADVPALGAGGNGHGLAGMQERAHAVGGRVRTSRLDGGWQVWAELPRGEARSEAATCRWPGP
jgi:signal transduction histidine kinase